MKPILGLGWVGPICRSALEFEKSSLTNLIFLPTSNLIFEGYTGRKIKFEKDKKSSSSNLTFLI